MIDLIGKRITTVSGTEYLLTEIAGQGAQGAVYKEDSGNYMIKLYFMANEIQTNSQVNKINWLLQQSYPERFIMPLEMVKEPYIGYVMKRVKGHFSLNKLLIPSKELNFSEWYNSYAGGLRRRLYIGYQIAQAFYILHNKYNRAYCDISGNNILVVADKTKVSVCMIDIDNLYVPGTDKSGIMGTMRYMAPEIANNQMEPDILTDDYSLAVILFELLRAGHPYIGDKISNGSPEMENNAYKGFYPYVDDDDNDFNRSSQMLPDDIVFTTKLRELFKKTFVDGNLNRMDRTTAFEFARACLEAANLLIKCKFCKSWYYPVDREGSHSVCPWCENKNQIPLFLSFRDSCKRWNNDKSEVEIKSHYSYILRESNNDITDNYIYRDIIDVEIKPYFKIKYKKDNRKYYLLNPDNNEVWYLKKGTSKPIQIGTVEKQEINHDDRIYFSKLPVSLNDSKYIKGEILRYAIVKEEV